MNRKQYLLTLAIVAVISFIGGIVGGAISGGGFGFRYIGLVVRWSERKSIIIYRLPTNIFRHSSHCMCL